MTGPFWLNPADRTNFPHVEHALREPDGLLAVGGDLSIERLLAAYRRGIFPWYSEGQPILWWSPDPRALLCAEDLHVSRSLARFIRRTEYTVTLDKQFSAVIMGCAAPRRGEPGTWITPEMKSAFLRLYKLGYAHSVEVWQGEELVGGLYGVCLGRMFYGESMFSRRVNASKVALVHLVRQLARWDFGPLDCQVQSAHLLSLGARGVPRREFGSVLDHYCAQRSHPVPWEFEPELLEAVRKSGGRHGG